jgi:hypothetical protein
MVIRTRDREAREAYHTLQVYGWAVLFVFAGMIRMAQTAGLLSIVLLSVVKESKELQPHCSLSLLELW